MGVYEPLQDFLKVRSGSHWKASFAELEQILRRPLPKSAYRYQAWWANQEGRGHSQTAAWRDIGWRTTNLDLSGETVEFERVELVNASSPVESSASPLLRRAAMYLGTTDETALVEEGLKALIEREAARRLARLGGTMPSFEAAPRHRTDGE